jgi:DNA-directed RNA polymerase subunit RPC12/RpoP
MDVPTEIVCVDCGGRCFLLSHVPPDEGFRPGDWVAYRCGDCMDRWDLQVPDDDGTD